MTDARSPRTAAGRALLADFEAFDVDTFDVDEYRKTILAIEAQAAPPDAHPRTYSLTASGPNGELFLVTDDESGINIGHAKEIGGPLMAPRQCFHHTYEAAAPDALREAATNAADWLDLSQKMYHLLVQKFPRESEDTCDAGMCGSMREHRDAIRAALSAAPATLPAIDTRIVWKRDHGMVIVHSTGDEEPQSLEIPAWAVRTIFDVAGKDPEEEARKVSAFINAHTGLDVERLARAIQMEVPPLLGKRAMTADLAREVAAALAAAYTEQGDAGER